MPSRADNASIELLSNGNATQSLSNTEGLAVSTQALVARDIWRSFNRAAIGSKERRSFLGKPGDHTGSYRRSAVKTGWLVLRMRMGDSGMDPKLVALSAILRTWVLNVECDSELKDTRNQDGVHRCSIGFTPREGNTCIST